MEKQETTCFKACHQLAPGVLLTLTMETCREFAWLQNHMSVSDRDQLIHTSAGISIVLKNGNVGLVKL